MLAKMIKARGVDRVEAVLGTTAKKKRKGTIEALRTGELQVMIATSLADEGLDVRRLSRVLLAWPQRAKGGTTQRAGRLLRDFPKKPKLIDFVDSKVDTLASRAADRKAVYRKMGLLPKRGEK
jgi:superfamily II DNA or RNA helicase